jgi:signal transduction histidine kinase
MLMPNLLIVDDDEALLSTLVSAFKSQGYLVDGAKSSPEALEKLERAAFDALLTDQVMPGMDGLALLERVRARFPDLAIVVMTGGGTVESAVRALKGGASDYVAKPFRLQEIFHVVERCLDQHRLRRENVQLGEINRRLQEVDQLKSNLLSAVSHEFRTPLTIMHGWLDLLLAGEFGSLSPQQAESLAAVRKSAVRLARLIANLLAFVECERGQGLRRAQAVNLERLLRNAAADLAPDCAERKVNLRVEAAPGLSMARGDDDHLRLLFFNLMENAVKFNKPGGSATVRVSEDGEFLEVRVTNSHGAIPPEIIPRLLQPFTQGDMGLSRPAGGLGLGLALVRAIASAHGGQITLEAGEPGGTTARIRLPSVSQSPSCCA